LLGAPVDAPEVKKEAKKRKLQVLHRYAKILQTLQMMDAVMYPQDYLVDVDVNNNNNGSVGSSVV
jgi:hypothetical protein